MLYLLTGVWKVGYSNNQILILKIEEVQPTYYATWYILMQYISSINWVYKATRNRENIDRGGTKEGYTTNPQSVNKPARTKHSPLEVNGSFVWPSSFMILILSHTLPT